jgi:transcriptional regulator with XRE-family HTH domain
MKKSTTVQCALAVSLFRGLYARVARNLGVDVSYISRIAHGKRKSKVAEKAINREFDRILASIRNSLAPTDGNRRSRTRKNNCQMQ